MIRTSIEWPLWRYPSARLADEGRWVAFTGEPDYVRPAGVLRSDHDFDARAVSLRSSVGDAFDDFRLLAVLPEQQQPGHLLDHVRRFGLGALCQHGRPKWHSAPARANRRSCPYPAVPGVKDKSTGLRVDQAAALAGYFDAVLDAAWRCRRRQRLPAPLVRGLTEWPPLTFGDTARGEVERDGTLTAARGRQLVAATVEAFLRQAATRAGVSWVGHRRPEPTWKVEDSWGLYGVEMMHRLALDDEPAPTYTCAACGSALRLPRRPRADDLSYCRTPECQRVRWRRNKARQRHERPQADTGRAGEDG